MLIGPVFTRELVTAPRRMRFYVSPAVYVGGLLILASTAWLLFTGTQAVRNVGDTARFGGTLFGFLRRSSWCSRYSFRRWLRLAPSRKKKIAAR